MTTNFMVRPSKFFTKTTDLIVVVLMLWTCGREMSVLNLDQDTAVLNFSYIFFSVPPVKFRDCAWTKSRSISYTKLAIYFSPVTRHSALCSLS
jgi:hypothetical protein